MFRRDKLVGLAIASIVSVSSLAGAPQEPVPVRIGVLAKRGPEVCLKKWGPTAEYLTNEIPGYYFTVVPLAYDRVYSAVELQEVDFVLANSGFYVGLELSYGVSRIVTLKNQHLGKTYTTYGGVIFCRADRDDIKSFADLKGKTFMSLDETAFASWRATSFELKEEGIDPYRDFAELSFESPMDAVVLAVLDGRVDAGSIRTDLLERMAMEGTIRLEDIRVLRNHEGEYIPGLLHSTRAYPEWPFAKANHTSNLLAEQVAGALLRMSPDDPAAQAASSTGWTIPHNYQLVHECLKTLRVGPYEDYGQLTAREAFRQFWPWGLAPLLFILLIFTARQTQSNRSLRRAIAVREQAEQTLQESEQDYQDLFKSMREGFALVEAVYDKKGKPKDYRFLKINPAFEEQSGMDAKATVGRTIREIYPDIEELWIDRYGGVAVNQVPIHFEDYNHNTDRYYDVTAFSPSKGKCAMLFRDITDRKQAEEELTKYRGHLEELVEERTVQVEAANKELEAFAYSVSHDLRAPLRAIDGFSQVLLEDYRENLDELGMSYLDRVRAGTQRMGRLIDDLLQLSRLSLAEMHIEDVDLSAIAAGVADELRKGNPERAVEFVIETGVTGGGDANLLGVVLSNLLDNAWRFSSKKDRARIEFGVEREKGEHTYFIRDNGAGFDMAYADKLFGAFQRLHRQSEFPGEGIGLATVQRIIHRHGGRVWATGGVDEGATFYFTLQSSSKSV